MKKPLVLCCLSGGRSGQAVQFLAANGVDDARIEIDGEEVPLLDGSAQNWCQAIAKAGITNHNSTKVEPKAGGLKTLP